MSVAEQLGLDDETSELLALADQRWDHWATAHPALTHCCGVRELRSWLCVADQGEADEALHALATLAAADGGDDLAAAAALACALMPGACLLANRLRALAAHIDQIVAAQLWLEVRTFAWRRMTKVAANVLLNTRAGVLADCDVRSQLERTDPTWSRTSPVDPFGTFWGGYVSTHCQRWRRAFRTRHSRPCSARFEATVDVDQGVSERSVEACPRSDCDDPGGSAR
jgi:hypothetical protein